MGYGAEPQTQPWAGWLTLSRGEWTLLGRSWSSPAHTGCHISSNYFPSVSTTLPSDILVKYWWKERKPKRGAWPTWTAVTSQTVRLLFYLTPDSALHERRNCLLCSRQQPDNSHLGQTLVRLLGALFYQASTSAPVLSSACPAQLYQQFC